MNSRIQSALTYRAGKQRRGGRTASTRHRAPHRSGLLFRPKCEFSEDFDVWPQAIYEVHDRLLRRPIFMEQNLAAPLHKIEVGASIVKMIAVNISGIKLKKINNIAFFCVVSDVNEADIPGTD